MTLTAPELAASTAVVLPRKQPVIRDEALAVRKAEEKIATFTHVGPHHGPGSGSGVGFCISKMYGTMERLDTWKDYDTDEEDEDEARAAWSQPQPSMRINRLMMGMPYS